MNTNMNKGIVVNVRMIDPSDIQKMDEDEIVIVNRVRLNSKLVECEISNQDSANIIIIIRAIRSMKEQESKKRRTVMGARMRVGDVKKVFPEYMIMPKNSFALATE